MLVYSKETLHHFLCKTCVKWFSIADFSWEEVLSTDSPITCPHCGTAHKEFKKAPALRSNEHQ